MVTAIGRDWGLSEEQSRKMFEAQAPLMLLGRVGLANDIANNIVWLASSDAENVTGTIMVNDSGHMIKPASVEDLEKMIHFE